MERLFFLNKAPNFNSYLFSLKDSPNLLWIFESLLSFVSFFFKFLILIEFFPLPFPKKRILLYSFHEELILQSQFEFWKWRIRRAEKYWNALIPQTRNTNFLGSSLRLLIRRRAFIFINRATWNINMIKKTIYSRLKVSGIQQKSQIIMKKTFFWIHKKHQRFRSKTDLKKKIDHRSLSIQFSPKKFFRILKLFLFFILQIWICGTEKLLTIVKIFFFVDQDEICEFAHWIFSKTIAMS